MLGSNGLRFFRGSGDERPSCQVIGLAEQAARALVNGGERLFVKG